MSLSEYKVLITAGPTREFIDPVRFISNPSTGKMGIALADAAFRIGSETRLIHGPVHDSLIKDKPYQCFSVIDTGQMCDAVIANMESNTILIMAAAPADYTPEEKMPLKMKKGQDELILRLKRTPDILETVGKIRKERHWTNVYIVGFAAETHDGIAHAREKLTRKNLDIICLNNVMSKGAGFSYDTNEIVIIDKKGNIKHVGLKSKENVALDIFNFISEYLPREI